MCYSFELFMLAFAVSIGIYLPPWYCNGPDIRIKNLHILEGIIILVGLVGAGSVIAAYILLGVCIQTMNHDPTVSPLGTFSPLGGVYIQYAVGLSSIYPCECMIDMYF